MLNTSAPPGAHTREEILSEPRCWGECLRHLASSDQIDRILQLDSLHKRWLFVGCGSSYYLALSAAASWTALTGIAASAVPASELLLFPQLILPNASACQPVLISRSGHTSEILKVAEDLQSQRVPIVAVTCAPDEALKHMASAAICLPIADEKSMVMTRSFSSMLLAIQALAAAASGNQQFLKVLESVSSAAQNAVDSMASRIAAFVDNHEFADYACLGQGPYYGLACEAALKVQEMSCSYSQSFHTMEFRHGPKAIVDGSTLIVTLLSRTGFEAEREVLEEVKRLGGMTLVVANEADERTRRAADLLIELGVEDDEYASLVAHALPGQLLGLCTGLKKGLDPDHPRHLSRVVTLNS